MRRRGCPPVAGGQQHSFAEEAWRKEPVRGRRARHTSTGASPGTWEIPSSPPKKEPARAPADQRSRLAAGDAPQRRERSEGAHRRYGSAKATELGRMGGGKSESSIVPTKPGNRPEGPGGGKGAPGHGTEGGTDVGIAESREHLNATSTDSKAGEGGPRAVVHEPGSLHRRVLASGGLFPDS